MPRDLAQVLADINAVPGVPVSLRTALAMEARSVVYTSPEAAQTRWVVIHAILRLHLGIPPKGDLERRAWAIWTGRPGEETDALLATLDDSEE